MRNVLIISSAVAAVLACGPIDQAGSSSVGPSDGGALTDGGVASGGGSGGAPDGGAASGGGATDGGATAGGGGIGGGSTGGGGSGAGTCDGVLPAGSGVQQSARLAQPKEGEDKEDDKAAGVCWYFTSDLSGNVAGESHSHPEREQFNGNWQIFSPSGVPRGTFGGVAGDVYGQEQGFESTRRDGATSLVLFGPDGRPVRSTRLDEGDCRGRAFPSAAGGSLVLDACGSAVSATRFDGQGRALVSVQLGQVSSASGITDARSLTLVVFSPGSAVGVNAAHAARWYDANLAPLTPFFAAPGSTGNVIVRPLAGGGAALQVGGSWAGTSQGGAASFELPPDWLAAHRNFDLQLIRGGKAYALIPRSGASPHNALDLFSSGGASCGSISFPTDGLAVGYDGTVIGSAGEGGCDMTWWSGLLK